MKSFAPYHDAWLTIGPKWQSQYQYWFISYDGYVIIMKDAKSGENGCQVYGMLCSIFSTFL
jgi:hypothetical protein